MKGATGLILAVFLGLVGGVVNWFYIESRTRDADTVSFLGVREGQSLRPGETFNERDFVEVRIPERNARTLREFAYLYEDRATFVGLPATRDYNGGDLIYRTDYRTPPLELKLEPNEEIFWVPVDSNSFVPSLANPGDGITFIIPAVAAPEMPVGERDPDDETGTGSAVIRPPFGTEYIEVGPFRIKTLGDRLGSVDVMKATRRAPMQERQIGIVIDTKDPEEVERGRRLQGLLIQGNTRNIRVKLHPRR